MRSIGDRRGVGHAGLIAGVAFLGLIVVLLFVIAVINALLFGAILLLLLGFGGFLLRPHPPAAYLWVLLIILAFVLFVFAGMSQGLSLNTTNPHPIWQG